MRYHVVPMAVLGRRFLCWIRLENTAPRKAQHAALGGIHNPQAAVGLLGCLLFRNALPVFSLQRIVLL